MHWDILDKKRISLLKKIVEGVEVQSPFAVRTAKRHMSERYHFY